MKNKEKDKVNYLEHSEFHMIKYMLHPSRGTTLDILFPTQGLVIFVPFILYNLPVKLERVYRSK